MSIEENYKSVIGELRDYTAKNGSFFETLLNNIPIPVFIKNKDGKYIGANDAFCKFFGAGRDVFLGKNISELTAPDIASTYIEKDNELFQNPGQTQKYEFVVDCKHHGGEIRNVVFYKNVFFCQEGEIGGIIGCIQDVTERLQYEKALLELSGRLQKSVEEETLKKLEKERILIEQSKNAMMGEMISIVAHQWKQPLNAISLLTQGMQLDSEDGELTAENFKDYTDKILKQVDHMVDTINDFRNFFRSAEPKTQSIQKNIEDSVTLLGDQFRINDITVDISGDDFLIMSVASELKQVFVNILVNAKDQMVSQKPECRDIYIVLDSGEKSVCVSDRAGGINENIIDIVFEPYVSAKGDKGTGIGLYMVKMIVEGKLNGKIEAKNQNGGAVFKIFF